jgi:hypothetical protein
VLSGPIDSGIDIIIDLSADNFVALNIQMRNFLNKSGNCRLFHFKIFSWGGISWGSTMHLWDGSLSDFVREGEAGALHLEKCSPGPE